MEYPAYAVRFLTYELTEALAVLSEQQQRLIAQAIFKDRYTGGRALIPWKYIGSGPGKLVSDDSYSGRGWQDAAGKWHDVGWHHQEAFVLAVKLAKRAVLEAGTEDGLAQVAKAKDKARARLARLTGIRIDIAENALAKDADRLKAIKDNEELALLGLATPAGDEQPGGDDAAADWWRAATGGGA